MTQQTIDGDKVRAYVYSGDWVGDCTRPGCNNVEHLFRSISPGGPRLRRVDFFHCSYCGREAFVDWPRIMVEISQVLMRRPIPSTRNWYPRDHSVAVRFNIPHGQSVQDLENENEENGVH